MAALNQAVKRNDARFPADFAFQLASEEIETLISQNVISKPTRGGRTKPPRAFTEHGPPGRKRVKEQAAVAMSLFVIRPSSNPRSNSCEHAVLKKLAEIERRLRHDSALRDLITNFYRFSRHHPVHRSGKSLANPEACPPRRSSDSAASRPSAAARLSPRRARLAHRADGHRDVTFDYDAAELGLDEKSAVRIKEIKQLRPLSGNQPWGIFFVNFEKKRLPVMVMRRILRRSSSRSAPPPANRAPGVGPERPPFHLRLRRGRRSRHHLRPLRRGRRTRRPCRVCASSAGTTTIHRSNTITSRAPFRTNCAGRRIRQEARRVAQPMAQRLRAAPSRSHHHVEATRPAVSPSLAKKIRARVRAVLRTRIGCGQIRKLETAFKAALIHDLSDDDFADMYRANHHLRPLLRRRLPARRHPRRQHRGHGAGHQSVPARNAQDLSALGGRKGGIDFDELGIQEVVDSSTAPTPISTPSCATSATEDPRRRSRHPLLRTLPQRLRQAEENPARRLLHPAARRLLHRPQRPRTPANRVRPRRRSRRHHHLGRDAEKASRPETPAAHRRAGRKAHDLARRILRPNPRPRHRHRHVPRRSHRRDPPHPRGQVEKAAQSMPTLPHFDAQQPTSRILERLRAAAAAPAPPRLRTDDGPLRHRPHEDRPQASPRPATASAPRNAPASTSPTPSNRG